MKEIIEKGIAVAMYISIKAFCARLEYYQVMWLPDRYLAGIKTLY
jgi:hypothetical protein